jgi:3-dehydroquinate synthetase
MTIITRAAVHNNACPSACLDILENLLEKYNLPNSSPFNAKEIFEASLTDKKRMGDFITEVIPQAVGDCILHKIPVADLLSWIEKGLL